MSTPATGLGGRSQRCPCTGQCRTRLRAEAIALRSQGLLNTCAVASDRACRVNTIEGDGRMSELAFTVNGDTFDVPNTVAAWRVRRLKPRGAPELVYSRDGRPLTLPIE